MNSKKILIALIVVVCVALGAITIIPIPAAHHVSHLGYKAVCSFAPISTATLLAFAAVFAAVGLRKVDA